ncbi:MAG: hypothetical protein WCY02_03585 [Parvibaculum sp.]
MTSAQNWNRTGFWLGGSLLSGLALGYAAGNDALQRLYPAPTVAAIAEEEEGITTTPEERALIQPERYVEFGQFVVPVLRAGQTTAFILADITLDPGSVEKAVRIRSSLPRYRDVILRTLYAEAGKGVFEGPNFNPDRLGDHLGKALVAAAPEIGDGKVMFQRLLLQNNTR